MIAERASAVERLVARFTELCADDGRIVAAMLTGSRARDAADEHSDIDLCAITTDVDLEAVLADRDTIVGRLGTPLFWETFGDPRNLHFILADGVEGELLCERESDLRRLDVGPFVPLVDKRGVLSSAEFPFPEPDPQVDRERLGQIVNWFWHDVSHLITAMARGDLWWAAGQLHVLRGACLNVVRITTGVGAAEGEDIFWKLTRDVSPADLAQLASTFVPLERDQMYRAAREIVAFFGEAAPPAARTHDVAYPEQLASLVTAKLDALGDRFG